MGTPFLEVEIVDERLAEGEQVTIQEVILSGVDGEGIEVGIDLVRKAEGGFGVGISDWVVHVCLLLFELRPRRSGPYGTKPNQP